MLYKFDAIILKRGDKFAISESAQAARSGLKRMDRRTSNRALSLRRKVRHAPAEVLASALVRRGLQDRETKSIHRDLDFPLRSLSARSYYLREYKMGRRAAAGNSSRSKRESCLTDSTAKHLICRVNLFCGVWQKVNELPRRNRADRVEDEPLVASGDDGATVFRRRAVARWVAHEAHGVCERSLAPS